MKTLDCPVCGECFFVGDEVSTPQHLPPHRQYGSPIEEVCSATAPVEPKPYQSQCE